jgi:hypothetical protein
MLLSALVGQTYANIEVQPNAVLSVEGGLVHDTGSNYVLWVRSSGLIEYKTASASLFRFENGGWTKLTSVSASGSTSTISNEITVLLSAGYYKVECTAQSPTSTASRTYYYTI